MLLCDYACKIQLEMLVGFLQEGALLPDRGKAVTDQQIAEDMLADLEEQRPDIEDQQ